MSALAIVSEPPSLVVVHDQCSAVEAWAEQCSSIAELTDAKNKLAAIDEYLSRTAVEGRGRVAETMRRLEVRIGQLLGPGTASQGRRTDLRGRDHEVPHIDNHAKRDFRVMAENEGVVEAVIATSTDEAPASRRKVMQAIKNTRPIGDPTAPKRARVNVEAREAEIREMARKGFSSVQMSNRLDMTPDGVKLIAKRIGIDIPADASLGKKQNRKFDGDRIVATIVHDLEGARMTIELVDYSALDNSRIEGWVDSLTESIRALNKLKTNLVKESTREEG